MFVPVTRTIFLGAALLLSCNIAHAQFGGIQLQIGNGGVGYSNYGYGTPVYRNYGNYGNGFYYNQGIYSNGYGYGNNGYYNNSYYGSYPNYGFRSGAYYVRPNYNYPIRRYRRW